MRGKDEMKRRARIFKIFKVFLLVAGILGIILLFSCHRIYEYKLKNPQMDSEPICLLEDVYNQLKDHSFDWAEFDSDDNVIILRCPESNERVKVAYKGDLQPSLNILRMRGAFTMG